MNNLLGTAYAELREKLIACVSGINWPSPEAGFIHYLQRDRKESSSSTSPPVPTRLKEAPILASNGYLYCFLTKGLTSQFNEEWNKAFERLLQRDPFPADRESYFYRPLELLGICLGARHCPETKENFREELRRILQDGRIRLDEQDLWNFSIASFGAWQLGVNWKRTSVQLPERLQLDELCLLRWLLKQGSFGEDTDLAYPTEIVEERIVMLCFTQPFSPTSLPKAGMVLHVSEDIVETRIDSALKRTWSTGDNTVAAIDIIATLARRFHAFAVQLEKRHAGRRTIKTKDEYDVQDILHALLKLHFEDVRPEEWTPSHAGSSTRMDFLLKREKIVVEAKMTRKHLDQKEVLKQLTEDIERYRSHQDCKTLICFVYDPGGYCKNPTALEDDLSGKRGPLDVIVHVYPKP